MRVKKAVSAAGAVVVAAATLSVWGMPGVAKADTVGVNSVVVNGATSINVGGSTTVGYTINATATPGTDPSGCDASGSSRVTLTPSAPSAVTISPTSQSVAGCGNTTSFTFSSSKAGDYSITVTATGGRTGSAFDTSGAAFTLHVISPNTAPTVTVSGPTNGTSYEKGSVPAATCNIVDAEDGNSTKAATLSTVTGPLSSYGLGSQTASCSYTDAGGLNATASVTYSIVDTTPPVLTVPGDTTAEATSASGARVTWTASAIDAVDPSPSVTCTPSSGSTFALGSTQVSCTAKDEAGNQATSQFNVTVSDTTAPALTLPSDITKEATGPSGATATYTATATDAVDGAVTPTCTPSSGSTFAIGRTPVNCSATDAHANTATGGFNVTVEDTTAPTLHLPADQTLEATGPDGAALTYSATATDAVDGTDTVSCDSPSGTVFGLGTTTVSCTATDAHGNRRNGSFKVTVQDTTAPTLTLPDGVTAEATGPHGANVTYSDSASDLVDGSSDAVDCAPVSGNLFPLGDTTVECSVTDQAGNKATGSFTVTVEDTTPPALTDLPGDQTIEATGPDGASATFTKPTASDLVDGTVPVSCDAASGDTFALGATKVTCSATDNAGNKASTSFTITVQDTTPPAFHDVPANITKEATGPDGATATFTAPTATDLVDVTDPVTCDSASGDTFPLGVTTVTCKTADNAGNKSSTSFTVTVRDTTAPSVTVPDNITKEATGPSGASVTYSGESAVDTVDGSRPVSCVPPSGSTFALGATTVTCSATDKSGNTGQGGFTITVEDTTAPTLSVPADKTVEATGPNGAAVNFSPSADDIVDGAVTPDCTVSGKAVHSGDTFPLGATTVSCTATDAHGNTSDAQTFTITVVDTTAPVVSVPSDKTAEATGPDGAKVTFIPSATDLVDGSVPVSCDHPSGSTFPLGTTTVSCSATDAHGNTGNGSFKVTVQDTTAPSINALQNLTALATSSSGAPVTFTATATDLVDGTIPATCTPASGSTFAPGVTTVSCTATDAHGNTSSAKTFTVTVGFDWNGFLAPVDNNGVLNLIKGGSTVPLKWQVSNERGGYVSDLGIVNQAASGVIGCMSGALTDSLATDATGGTSLRYDSTANQYIYNWQSPKKSSTCYRVTIALTDGTSHTALFQLR
jgi:hypothetical protein